MHKLPLIKTIEKEKKLSYSLRKKIRGEREREIYLKCVTSDMYDAPGNRVVWNCQDLEM